MLSKTGGRSTIQKDRIAHWGIGHQLRKQGCCNLALPYVMLLNSNLTSGTKNGGRSYAIYNIGPYTFSPFKVVWKEQSSEFECAVISELNGKTIIPDHKLMMVDIQDEIEAHYLCALLNSSITRLIVRSYTISTSQSTHILEKIKIPKFTKILEAHQELARLSKICHDKVMSGINVSEYEDQINEIASDIWGINKDELKEVNLSLEDR